MSLTGPSDSARPVSSPAPTKQGPWLRWVALAVALLVGLGAGVGIGMAASRSDPKQSREYRTLTSSLSAAQQSAEVAKESAGAAVRSADASVANAEGELEQQLAAVQSSAASVSAAAASVNAAYQKLQENSIAEGVWVVGTDVQPGTYRTTAAVSGECYWSITKSGTNGGDIIENDIVTGGFPTVTLRAGQDFTNHGCGTFVKQ